MTNKEFNFWTEKIKFTTKVNMIKYWNLELNVKYTDIRADVEVVCFLFFILCNAMCFTANGLCACICRWFVSKTSQKKQCHWKDIFTQCVVPQILLSGQPLNIPCILQPIRCGPRKLSNSESSGRAFQFEALDPWVTRKEWARVSLIGATLRNFSRKKNLIRTPAYSLATT